MRWLMGLAFVSLLAASVPADHPPAATPADLRQLRSEVALLDDSLETLDPHNPRAREFHEREDQIRSDLVRLRDEITQHQLNEATGDWASKARVDELRKQIRGLRDDIDATSEARGSDRGDVSVPDGTQIQVTLEEGLSSRTSRPEDRVAATVAASVRENGRLAIPAGAQVSGTVQRVQRAERPSKGGRLEVSFDSLVMDGQRIPMRAQVVSVGEGLDKRKAGLGALIGGVLGAVVDGKKGALVGVLVGGTGAVVASSGDEVELPAGTVLTLRLERPLAVARR